MPFPWKLHVSEYVSAPTNSELSLKYCRFGLLPLGVILLHVSFKIILEELPGSETTLEVCFLSDSFNSGYKLHLVNLWFQWPGTELIAMGLVLPFRNKQRPGE